MKERPIIFSGPMVRAILDGRKTQTRRVVKPQPLYPTPAEGALEHGDIIIQSGWPVRLRAPRGRGPRARGLLYCAAVQCPYGQPGDRLWVRETFAEAGETLDGSDAFIYRADDRGTPDDDRYFPRSMHWHPSIHMPRKASRVTLEVTGVRVELVQDISEADAVAEGCHWGDTGERATPRTQFKALWDSINGKRPGCSWEANPWVWVVEFEAAREL